MARTIGITGMAGFMGSHLRDRLRQEKDVIVPEFEDKLFDDFDALCDYVSKCEVIFHLAAMNRGDDKEIYRVNIELVKKLIESMEKTGRAPYVLFSSSTQIERDNAYSKSKRHGAELLQKWAEKNLASLLVLVIPNVFGDCGKPFYNSVVATFCHQITHGDTPKIMTDAELNLIYINELTDLMTDKALNPIKGTEVFNVPSTSKVRVSEISSLLEGFKENYYQKKTVPAFKKTFERNLYNTFITYMDALDFEQKPLLHSDNRGSLFEVVKQEGMGQVFFSTTKPDITRGNHYHTRKMEKFCVVKGKGLIRMRRIGTDKIVEFKVTGDNPSSIEMPIFYTHNITNIGDDEMLTLFWTNEIFDPDNPDTFYEEV